VSGATGAVEGIVGREAEVVALGAFVGAEAPRRALCLIGPPGAGKTTLWEAGIALAREQGLLVLSAQPSGAEAELSFAALIDLCEEIDAAALSAVLAPQRSALEVALLRAEPTGTPPQPHAIALGFLNGLRALAARRPVLVAVDDVQWLDAPSADALTFVARRLEDEPVRFLLARRPGARPPLELALDRGGLERLDRRSAQLRGDAAAAVRAFPVAPELVEALAALGETDEAAAVTDRLRELAERQEHPWALATAKRCAAVTRLAESYDEAAAASLAQAAADYGRMGLPFDLARTLLSLGRAQRRVRKWGAARAALDASVRAFDELGSGGWADAARSELARVGARKPSPSGELTAAERKTAELAAEGLANKQIAQALHVTVGTVEVHLSRSYAKLGIRSRAQLAARLSAEAQFAKDSGFP
jgi:DNA-binding CsgD family transcriptional regulator